MTTIIERNNAEGRGHWTTMTGQNNTVHIINEKTLDIYTTYRMDARTANGRRSYEACVEMLNRGGDHRIAADLG